MASKLLVIQCEKRSRSDTTVIVLKENCTFNLSIEKETQETHYLGRSQLHSYLDILPVQIKKRNYSVGSNNIHFRLFQVIKCAMFFERYDCTIVRLWECTIL